MNDRLFRIKIAAILLLFASFSQTHAGGDGIVSRILDYYRNRPYPVDHFAPGNYGYNLDDQSRSYFGGGRYTEYYNYGRGGNLSNLANFPGPAPGPQWLYDNRNWIGTQPVRPFAGTPPMAQPQVVAAIARLSLNVPANSIVWLEDQPMRQTGPVREYISPPLEPGVSYTYTIRARWIEGNQQLEQVQSVPVMAGQNRTVVFGHTSLQPIPQAPALLPVGMR